MTAPSVRDWWVGSDDARAVGVDALTRLGWLTPDQPDIRKAVTRWQKKHHHTPTSTLTAAQWEQLLEEAALPVEHELTATDVPLEGGPTDE